MTSDGEPGGHDWVTPGGTSGGQAPYFGGGATGYPTAVGPPAYPSPPPGWGPSGGSRYGAAAHPGLIPLRPLGVGELLDGGFALIRRYPVPALGLTALVMLAVQVVHFVASYLALHGVTNDVGVAIRHGSSLVSDGDYVGRSAIATGVSAIVGFIASLVVTGLITTIVGRGVLGRPLTAGDTWRRTRPVLGRLLAVSLLVPLFTFLVVVGCLLPGIVVLAAAGSGAGAALLAIGGIAAVGLAVYLVIGWEFAAPAVVLEKARVFTALSRSRALVRGSWWRVFGVVLLTTVIAGVVGLIVQLPFALAGGVGDVLSGRSSDNVTFLPLLLASVGGLLSATLVRPFTTGVVSLLYVDRRMRAEALDLTLTQAAAGTES